MERMEMGTGPKIFLTRELPPGVMRFLEGNCELRVNPHDRPVTRAELIDGVRDRDGLICLLTDRIDAEVLDAAPNLRVVSNYAVGYDNIDVAAATARGIVVTNTPGVLTDATADLAWALLFAAARRVIEGDRLVRSGTWSGWAPQQLLGLDITERTLGVVGMGRIGRAVAERGRGFRMNVLYWNRTPLDPAEERRLGVERRDLDDLLRESDFVSLHVALTPDTRHLIGERELHLMKPTACLINTARGAVIDEQALVRALRQGRIACAGLDVYEHEPALPPGLAGLDNVVLLPHLGSATVGTRTRMGLMAAEDCLRVCRGERPLHPVNPEVFAAPGAR